MTEPNLIPESIRRIFAEGFRVGDIAEPLLSLDDSASSESALVLMDEAGFDALGLRRRGRVVGFVERSQLGTGTIGDAATAFDTHSVVVDTASLSLAVTILTRLPRVFVESFGAVNGIVTREDLEKPPMRMWLFGMVTMIEMRYARLIAEQCPNDSWREYLSPGRQRKAEELLEERRRRGQASVTLLDCLQIADKGQIVARNEGIRRQTIFASRAKAEEGIKLLQGLRNNLAHAQDIVSTDWEAIVNLSQQLQRVLTTSTGPAQASSQ